MPITAILSIKRDININILVNFPKLAWKLIKLAWKLIKLAWKFKKLAWKLI